MTDTITATGTLEHIDPEALILEANVRPSAPVDKDFVATIKQFGVLMPVLARRDEHGNVLVRAGQRRTLGAREAGVATIPVYITNADDKTAERIIEQIVENDQRKELTDGDRAAAYQQLAFEGLSVATIAKRVGVKRDVVQAGISVAENATAASAINAHDLTLDQAAVLIEFEGEDDIVDRLIEVATSDPAGFEHAAQRARDDKERAESIAQATDDVLVRGFRILDRQPSTWQADEYTNINDLATDGERATVENIEALDGRAAYVDMTWDGDVRVSYYLPTDGFKVAGFKKRASDGTVRQPMTEDEKAERKVLIANNKAWKSAETVRRAWLAGLVNRKTLPKDTARFIARGVTEFAADLARGVQNGNTLAHEFFNVDRGSSYYAPDKLAGIVEATPTKANHVSLAVVLGAIEGGTSVQTWRSPDRDAAAYFAQIAAWGYPLSEVEQLVIDKHAELQEIRAAQRAAHEAQIAADEASAGEIDPSDEDIDAFDE